MKSEIEKITEIFLNIFGVAIGLLFVYLAGHHFLILQSRSMGNAITESQKADIQSIVQNHDPSAISLAVSRIMERPDIVRVHVLLGDIQYPSFEIRRGKNESPRDVDQWANTNENGYSVSIGYAMTKSGATSSEQDYRTTGMALGSFFGGFIAICFR
jgi:hypothetical protein